MSKLKVKNNFRAAAFVFLMLVMSAAYILCFSNGAVSQNSQQLKKQLEDKKKQLQKEIEYKNKLLKEVKNTKNQSMLQLAIINNKIKDQEELIGTLNSEIVFIDGQIIETNNAIKKQEADLQKLKDEYAKMVFYAYKNRSSFDRLMFVFAAQDFNQAWQRMKYFQLYSQFRKKQGTSIETKKKELNDVLLTLEQKKSEQNSLLSEKEVEKKSLSDEKTNKESVLTDLQQKEKDLKDELKQKKQLAEKVKKAIDKLIEEEIKKQQELIASKNKKKDNSPVDLKKKKKNYDPKIEMTPEEEIVSKNFEGNSGKLPWPLKEGVITEKFGTHEHPDLAGVMINSNGVEMTTNKGSDVRAIFEGEVTAIAEVGGLDGKIILIRHGEYITVYYTLGEVFVKTGDKVKTKQVLGKIYTDDDGKSILHFEIRKGKDLLDPENWISLKS